MLKIGITGNIGSGKSTVCRIFNSMQIPVFYADIEARMLYFKGDIKDAVKKAFGNRVFINDDVNTKALADIIFHDKIALSIINKIIHPAVLQRFNDWLMKNKDAPYILHEAAVLFENNLQKNFDKIICVTAPKQLRINRVIKRDKIEAKEVISRMKNQWPEDKKVALSDFIIINDGKNSLINQVLKIDMKIKNIISYEHGY